MAVVGGAEFELTPVLARNFRQASEKAINSALSQANFKVDIKADHVFSPALEKALVGRVAKAAKNIGDAFGIAFRKSVQGEVEEIDLTKAVRKQVISAKQFLVNELAGLQNEINRKAAQATVTADLKRQERLEAIRRAGGLRPRPELVDRASEAEARQQNADEDRIRELREGLLSVEQERVRQAHRGNRFLTDEQIKALQFAEKRAEDLDRQRASTLRRHLLSAEQELFRRASTSLSEIERRAVQIGASLNKSLAGGFPQLASPNLPKFPTIPEGPFVRGDLGAAKVADAQRQQREEAKVTEQTEQARTKLLQQAMQERARLEDQLTTLRQQQAAQANKQITADEQSENRKRIENLRNAIIEQNRIASRLANSRAADARRNLRDEEVAEQRTRSRQLASMRATIRERFREEARQAKTPTVKVATIASATSTIKAANAAIAKAVRDRTIKLNVTADLHNLDRDLADAAIKIRQLKAANEDKFIEIRAKLLIDKEATDSEIKAAKAKLEDLGKQTGATLNKNIEQGAAKFSRNRGGLGGFIDSIQSKFVKFSESITGRAGGLAQLLGAGLSGSVFVVAARLVERALQAITLAVVASAREFGNLEDAMNANNLLFRSASDRVFQFAASTDRVNLSITSALKAAQEFGTALVGIGLSDQGLADVSISLTKIAEDTASFAGTDINTVLARFAQAIQGDVRALRSLRINIRESDVEQEALRRGLKLQDVALGEAGRAAATYALIIERTSRFQNDAQNTAGALNNSIARLKATVQNLGATFGASFGPSLAKGITDLTDFLRVMVILTPTILKFVGAILSAIPIVRGLIGFLKGLGDAARGLLSALGPELQVLTDLNQQLLDARAKIENYNGLVRDQFNVLNRVVQAQLAYDDSLIQQKQAVLAVTQAEHALEDARIAMERQTFVIEQAELALAQARIQQRLVLLRAVAAEQFESRATIALKNARLDLLDAEQAYIDIKDPLTKQEREVDIRMRLVQATFEEEKSQLALTKALLAQQEAQLDIFDTTEKFIQLRRRGVASAAEIARAELAMRQAQLSGKEANIEKRETAALTPLQQEANRIATIRARQELERLDVTLAREIERARLTVASAIIAEQEAVIGLESQLLEERAATHAVTSAQHALDDAIRARLSLQDAYVAAELAVLSAKQGLVRANIDVKLAEDELKVAVATARNEVIDQKKRTDELIRTLEGLGFTTLPAVSSVISGMPRVEIGDTEEIKRIEKEIKDSTDRIAAHFNAKLGEIARSDAFSNFMRKLGEAIMDAFRLIGALIPGGAGAASATSLAPGGTLGVVIDVAKKLFGSLFGRQHGGPVIKGIPYLIGEKGPEIFVPKFNGSIFSAGDTRNILAKLGRERDGGIATSPNNFSQTNHFYNPPADPEIIANQIARKVLIKAL